MSHPVIDSQEHEKIMAMLPWYVNRTLELSDRQIVSDHLDQCEECQSEVDFLNTMNQVVEDDADVSYRAHADVDKSLANVMQRIDAEEAQISSKTPKSSLLLHKLNQLFFLPGNLSVPQWGATAIAGILVAVLGVWLYSNDAANDYSVLSSADISDSSLQLSVRFLSITSEAQAQTLIDAALSRTGTTATVAQTATGHFAVTFSDSTAVSALSQFITQLEEHDQVQQVEILTKTAK